MAYITVKYYSDCLKRNARFEMFLPNDEGSHMPWSLKSRREDDRPIKTLILLHGYAEDARNWVPEKLAKKYRIAVVTPEGENSFWLDGISTGHKYCTMLGEELVGYLRKTFGLARSAEETYLLGYSMGGFGAVHTGFAYPETFGKIGAMSSAMIVSAVSKMKNEDSYAVANFEYYRECFGEPSELMNSENDPEVLADRMLSEGRTLPALYMSCGTHDFLIENNRSFHAFLESRTIPHEYREAEGSHDMNFWSVHTEKILEWMYGQD